jgi:DNA-binding SARP family transcriptional activator/Tol biopolymer transport system component
MIELRVLGAFDLIGADGTHLDELRRRHKRAALLAYLAAAQPRGLHSRDRLVGLLWPRLDGGHARAALSQSLHLLRSSLGDSAFVACGDTEIALNRSVVSCDCDAFADAVAMDRPEQALALYRGDLLDGLFVSDAPEFERWLEGERERWRHRAADAAWSAAAQKAHLGDAVEATRLARRAADLIPADEAVARRLMRFLEQVGERAAALRAYEAFAWELAKEFEMEPSAETQAVAIAIRRSVTPFAPPRPASVNVPSDDSALPVAVQPAPDVRGSKSTRAVVGAVLMALTLLLAIALNRRMPESAPRPLVRLALTLEGLPPHATGIPGSTIALSPDGNRLVYVGVAAVGTQLFLRDLDRVEAIPIPGTEGAHLPFFSPSGEWLAFVSGNAIRRVKLSGGSPITICTIHATMAGASWGTTEVIVFATPAGLWRVPADGGEPILVLPNDRAAHVVYRWPEMLPGDKAAVLTRVDASGFHLTAFVLDTRAVIDLGVEGTNPHFIERGQLVFSRPDGSVRTVPIDARALRLTGPPQSITDGAVTGIGGAAKLGVSRNGTLAYVPEAPGRTLVLVKRNGRETPVAIPSQAFTSARFAPDGRRIALAIEMVGGQSDVWVFDQLTKGRQRVTFDSGSITPVWSPDGKRIAVATKPGGRDIGFSIQSVSAFAPDTPKLLVSTGPGQLPYAFTPDGKTLLLRRIDVGRRNAIWVLPLDGKANAHAFLRVHFDQRAAAISPDGHWVAYVSDESGRDEVYVRAFPDPGRPTAVSDGGGREPRWSASGAEIFYRDVHGLVAAHVRATSPIIVDSRELLFDDRPYESSVDGAAYDVHPDGQQFVMIRRAPERRDLIILMNWFDRHQAPGQSSDGT